MYRSHTSDESDGYKFQLFFVFGSNIFETTIELVGKTLCKVWNQKNTGAKSQRWVLMK